MNACNQVIIRQNPLQSFSCKRNEQKPNNEAMMFYLLPQMARNTKTISLNVSNANYSDKTVILLLFQIKKKLSNKMGLSCAKLSTA